MSRLAAAAAFALAALPCRAAELSEQYPEAEELFTHHCKQCHTIGEGERVGPDLAGVTKRRERSWLLAYIQNAPAYHESDPLARELLIQFEGMQMPDIEIEQDEVETLLAYVEAHDLQAASGFGTPPGVAEPPADVPANLIMPDERRGVWPPGIAILIVLLAGGALLSKANPTGAKIAFVLAAAAAYWSLGGRGYHRLPGDDQGYAPEQPVAFSHALHAGELEISCLYCHHQAERGPRAGVPAVSTCMNCHSVVKKPADAVQPSPEIAKVLAAWATRGSDRPEPIEWARVHKLPDFVRFNHQAHVTNGIRCQECHGPVEKMERLRQAASLSMGWCIQCHRLQKDEAPRHWLRAGATRDCTACHL